MFKLVLQIMSNYKSETKVHFMGVLDPNVKPALVPSPLFSWHPNFGILKSVKRCKKEKKNIGCHSRVKNWWQAQEM